MTPAVSPDGYHVYVGGHSDGTLSEFDRRYGSRFESASGRQTIGVNGVDYRALTSVTTIAFSPGGEQCDSRLSLYHRLQWYVRDASSTFDLADPTPQLMPFGFRLDGLYSARSRVFTIVLDDFIYAPGL